MLDPEKNKIIVDYLQPYNPVRIGIFGSYARNEYRLDSDLDILINLNTAISLFHPKNSVYASSMFVTSFSVMVANSFSLALWENLPLF